MSDVRSKDHLTPFRPGITLEMTWYMYKFLIAFHQVDCPHDQALAIILTKEVKHCSERILELAGSRLGAETPLEKDSHDPYYKKIRVVRSKRSFTEPK
jgi:hypothetical protein